MIGQDQLQQQATSQYTASSGRSTKHQSPYTIMLPSTGEPYIELKACSTGFKKGSDEIKHYLTITPYTGTC